MAAASSEITPHTWGDAPELYGPRHDYREGLMLRQLRPLLPAGHILNAGCGAGSLTMRLLERGYAVTSVDSSEPFVDHVRRRIEGLGLTSRATVQQGDLHKLNLPDEAFDGVVCGEVLEHLDDDQQAITELARVLRAGGVLVASVPANPWRYDWTDLWAGHRRRYTAEGLEQRLAAAGFTEVRVLPYGFPLVGFYHRHVYRRLLRRRLTAKRGDLGPPSGRARWAAALLRAAFELDSAFIGRRPGYFGLLVSARRPR